MKHKLAVLRENQNLPCPFGLPIPIACSKIGKTIYKMEPLSSDSKNIASILEANQHLLLWDGTGEKCPFAEKIVKNDVNCKFEEPKEKQQGLDGSPMFANMFGGGGPALDGLYTVPSSYYGQSPLESGPWYRYYSIETVASEENLEIKTGNNKP